MRNAIGSLQKLQIFQAYHQIGHTGGSTSKAKGCHCSAKHTCRKLILLPTGQSIMYPTQLKRGLQNYGSSMIGRACSTAQHDFGDGFENPRGISRSGPLTSGHFSQVATRELATLLHLSSIQYKNNALQCNLIWDPTEPIHIFFILLFSLSRSIFKIPFTTASMIPPILYHVHLILTIVFLSFLSSLPPSYPYAICQ